MTCGIFQFCVALGLTLTGPGTDASKPVASTIIMLTTKTPEAVNAVRRETPTTVAAIKKPTQLAGNIPLLPTRGPQPRLQSR